MFLCGCCVSVLLFKFIFHFFISDFELLSHFIVHWRVYFLDFHFANLKKQTFGSFFNLFFGHFYFLYMSVHLTTFCNIMFLLAVLGITLGVVAYLKIAQITYFCYKKFANLLNRKCFTLVNFINFLGQVNSYLVVLADANRVLGLSLFGFVLINVPLNAIFIMMLATGKIVNGNMRLASAVYVVVQLTFIFAVTGFFAMLSVKFHKPVKRVMSCTVEAFLGTPKPKTLKVSNWSFAGRFKLTRYIETFHTEVQFTVKYGKYGSVTFASLGKVFY